MHRIEHVLQAVVSAFAYETLSHHRVQIQLQRIIGWLFGNKSEDQPKMDD